MDGNQTSIEDLRALLKRAAEALEWTFDMLPYRCSGGDPESRNHDRAERALQDLQIEMRQNPELYGLPKED